MIEHYEMLRRSALQGGHLPAAAGLGLFLEQGMGVWVRTCSALPEPSVDGGRSGVGPDREGRSLPSLERPLAKELVMVVAEIVNRQLRGNPCKM